MNVSFKKGEYGRELEIRGVIYTYYERYGDKTEVEVIDYDIDDRLGVSKLYVLDGHLSIDRIVDKLLHEEDVFSFFEDEEEMNYYVDSTKLKQCFNDRVEQSYNAKRESKLLK